MYLFFYLNIKDKVNSMEKWAITLFICWLIYVNKCRKNIVYNSDISYLISTVSIINSYIFE